MARRGTLWDNEAVMKVAAGVAAGMTALGIFMTWGNAPDLLGRIVVILKVVSIGVGAGVALFVGAMILRLLIKAAHASVNAFFAALDWAIDTVLDFFSSIIRAILMAPIVLLRLVFDLIRNGGGSARQGESDRSQRAGGGDGEQRSQQNEGKQEQHQRQSSERFTDSGLSEKQALELFELTRPYTLEKLRARRMELLKKVHPDQGGSNMMARMVNEAYEVLKARV